MHQNGNLCICVFVCVCVCVCVPAIARGILPGATWRPCVCVCVCVCELVCVIRMEIVNRIDDRDKDRNHPKFLISGSERT